MGWELTSQIKKVYSKRVNNVQSFNESILLQTGKWSSPKPFVCSSFIGGGTLGKSVSCTASLSSNEVLSANVDMRDEKIQIFAEGEITRGSELPLRFTLPKGERSFMFSLVFVGNHAYPADFSPGRDWHDVGIKVKNGTKLLYETPPSNYSSGEDAYTKIEMEFAVYNYHFFTKKVGYGMVDISGSDDITIYIGHSNGKDTKAIGHGVYAISTIRKQSKNLDNTIDIVVIE